MIHQQMSIGILLVHSCIFKIKMKKLICSFPPLAHFLSDPTDAEVQCQFPKPILLNTGDISFPAPWTAKIVTLQMVQLGQFFIIAVPGEFSTMAGRRLRDTVRSTLLKYGASNDSIVAIAGLANDYTHYITTYQEYGTYLKDISHLGIKIIFIKKKKLCKDMKELQHCMALTHWKLINICIQLWHKL